MDAIKDALREWLAAAAGARSTCQNRPQFDDLIDHQKRRLAKLEVEASVETEGPGKVLIPSPEILSHHPARRSAMVSDDALKTVAARRNELTRWQTPKEFAAKVEELAGPIKSEHLFNDPAAQFLLDAIPIAEFTKLRRTDFVRLSDQRDQWPDGQVGTPKLPVNVEVTEVLEEGRRRGDEYRNDGQAKTSNVEDWRKCAEAIPALLENGIQRKVGKGYDKDFILLVYLNMSTYGVLQKETVEAIANIKAKYAQHFHEICILWQEMLL
jgi:hypothetical protein